MSSSPFNLQGLASALPASSPLSPTEQAEYARLRRRVETMGHGFDGDTHGAGKYYAVWAGRKIGIFADWFVLTFVVTKHASCSSCNSHPHTHLPRSVPTEYFVVIGKRSTSFFVDEDDARESAFALKELDELSVFCSAESLSDAVAQLEVGARDAAKAAAETRSRR
ncbi:hypothetical protein C8F01DRAFT_1250616 [Mycena amicta]|nr:hypothetical protein C8F01DRAFT_1250616 [Mycena amicta]